MNSIANIGGHGIGDCILSLQISNALTNIGVSHANLLSTRPQVFDALKFIFGEQISFERIDEKYSENNSIISDNNLQKEILSKSSCEDITYNIPDLVFQHPLSFNFEKYGLFMNSIRRHRLLPKKFGSKEKIIYCGLCSVHDYHIYKDIPNLLRRLAEFLPLYTIYFPHLSSWTKTLPNLGDFSGKFPENVHIDHDPNFQKSLEILTKSCYGLFTDNGPSHIAYHLGIPRLILDPEYQNILWTCRWKDDPEECLPIQTPINDIVNIITENIKCPQSTLIDKVTAQHIINNYKSEWNKIFYFKF